MTVSDSGACWQRLCRIIACSLLQLLAAVPPLPDLGAMIAGGGGGGGPQNLQDVIRNFLLAKQQASAAASVMTSLRGVIEGMQGQVRATGTVREQCRG